MLAISTDGEVVKILLMPLDLLSTFLHFYIYILLYYIFKKCCIFQSD